MKNTIILALLTLVVHIMANAVLPAPYCKSKQLYTHLPMTINETFLEDMDWVFAGYNLDFRVVEGGDFATVNSKMDLLSYKNYDFTRIINSKVTHIGNRWGNEMYVLSEDIGQTVLHFGTFTNHTESPNLEVAVAEYQENTTCFDAALFLDQGIAVVDCIQLTNGTWQNKFIYIDLAKRERVAQISNDMYGDFDMETKRKVMRYHDPHSGFEYLIRAYMSHDNNSYIQFFHASDIRQFDLEILRVIDRTQMNLKKLSIVDIKVYLGDIFVLDYYSGLYRLDILRGQLIAVVGHYPGEKYTHFSIYSDDLDQQIIFALSNKHAIYEINWDHSSYPYLVTKYTLPANSTVQNIVIDAQFVIAQASANVTNGNESLITNYTYIFTKGSRTYMNAYKVIEHHSTNVVFDYDRVEKRLMIVAQTNVSNYKLNDGTLEIYLNQTGSLNSSKVLKIQATSSDPHTNVTEVCMCEANVTFVTKEDKTIYATDLPLPKTYFANYPGIVKVNLRNYAIGPNITYNITDNNKMQYPPIFWLEQQNATAVTFDKTPITGNIEFFQAQVFPQRGNNTIFYFYQMPSNDFHVARCTHFYEDALISCKEVFVQSYRFRIKTFTTAAFMTRQRNFHMYTIVSIEGVNQVFINSDSERIASIQFPTGYEGMIGDIEASNGYLYVCLPYVKTIKVYKLEKCQNHVCPLEFEINAHTMASLGVTYFNPIDVVISRFHPEVLFINCLGSLIVVDLDTSNNLILLSEITSSAAVAVNGYKIAVHDDFLVIVAAPNIVEEYSIKDLYSLHKVKFLKNLYLYQYTLDPDFDLEFSDNDGLFYVTSVDGNTGHSTILVYKVGNPLVTSLYDVINLNARYKHSNLFIEICGFNVDYVNIISESGFQVVRQFPEPILVVEDTFEDFKLEVVYYNVQNNNTLATLNFSIANYPKQFNTTKQFEQNIKGKLKATQKGQYTWDPRTWFEGHIIGYNFTSEDPHVRLVDQIYERRVIPARGRDFVDSHTGGYALAEDLLKFHFNGSVEKVFLIPDQEVGERCLRLATRPDDLFTLTGCQYIGGGVGIYFTTQIDYRGFTWGPYITEAFSIRNMQMVNFVLVLTDTEEQTFLGRSGTIFLYALNLDPQTDEQMDLIQQIDSNDFFGAHGWEQEDAYLGNSHLVYDQHDNAYRLYVTEMYNGLFVMEFKLEIYESQLQVLTTNYIDLNKVLEENDFHMPSDARFLTVNFVSTQYNPTYEVENVIVTTDNYHNFEFTIVYDQNAQVKSCHLHRVYYRYGYYQGANIAKYEEGYLAIPYVIPEIIGTIVNYSRQFVIVYDTKDYDDDHAEGYSKRYILGGYQINNTVTAGFGFNVTNDQMHNGTRTGLVIIDVHNAQMHETSLSRNITVEVDQGYHSGKMTVIAYSDFHSERFDLEYVGPSGSTGLETWEIILIVVSCVVFALLMGYLFFLCWRRNQQKPVDEVRQSLMESETGAALLRYGTQQSTRGSVPQARQSHFRKTTQFQTQTDYVQEAEQKLVGSQSLVEPPVAVAMEQQESNVQQVRIPDGHGNQENQKNEENERNEGHGENEENHENEENQGRQNNEGNTPGGIEEVPRTVPSQQRGQDVTRTQVIEQTVIGQEPDQ